MIKYQESLKDLLYPDFNYHIFYYSLSRDFINTNKIFCGLVIWSPTPSRPRNQFSFSLFLLNLYPATHKPLKPVFSVLALIRYFR